MGDTTKLSHAFLKALAVCILWCPLFWLLSMAVRTETAFYGGSLGLLPDSFHLERLWGILGAETRYRFPLLNSILVSSFTAVGATALGLTTSLFLTQRRASRLGAHLGIGLLAVRFLPAASVVPGFYWLLEVGGILDSLTGLAVSNLGFTTSFAVLVLAPVIARIPPSHLEMAAAEGATSPAIVWRVVLPKTRAALLVVLLLNFTFAWNEFLLAGFISETRASQTLSVLIAGGVGQHSVDFGLLAAGGLLSLLPSLLIVMSLSLTPRVWSAWQPHLRSSRRS